MEDFPTLAELNAAFGRNTSAAWLAVQLADLSIYTGAKNLSKRQQDQLAEIITTEFYWLKVSELLLFFHRFKTGSYGTFFGAVDPMVVTRALREFILERNDIIAEVEAREKAEREREERRLNPPITREEWERIKAEDAQAAEKPVFKRVLGKKGEGLSLCGDAVLALEPEPEFQQLLAAQLQALELAHRMMDAQYPQQRAS